MSLESFAEKVGKATDRRRFLARAATGALTAVFAVIGLGQAAEANHCNPGLVHWRCCCLCRQNTGGGCGVGACLWCWSCCYQGQVQTCCEIHSRTGSCGPECVNILCSYGSRTNSAC
jgi:hypothetical protein